MPKMPPAFRRIERPNERSDTSVQSFDCALGSFAQASLHGMEGQLDGVKIRRILRQESEACANTPESLLDTSDFVEGHIGARATSARLRCSARRAFFKGNVRRIATVRCGS